MKETIRLGLILLVLAFIAQMNAGCASLGKKLKALVGGKPSMEAAAAAEAPALSTPRFSEQDNVTYNVDRKYRRMTRDKFEEEAEVGSQAGSLWVMEGQGSYLFAQNTTRLVGDLLNVRIEGTPKTQLQTKTRVIGRLLERLEKSETPAAVRAPAQAVAPGTAPADANAQGAAGASQDPAQAGAGTAPGGAPAPATNASPRAEAAFNVDRVPTRIVEVLKDGSYRVKGSQEFMIGKRDYKVIVTGIVRPEDFNEEGINAEKLLDSQFDIVSNRRGTSL